MTDWTSEALEAERERRRGDEARGVCPDAGYTIGFCWRTNLCDCAGAPPVRCPECHIQVWDLADHERRQHP